MIIISTSVLNEDREGQILHLNSLLKAKAFSVVGENTSHISTPTLLSARAKCDATLPEPTKLTDFMEIELVNY